METITITRRSYKTGKEIFNKRFDNYETNAFYGSRISRKEFIESEATAFPGMPNFISRSVVEGVNFTLTRIRYKN